MEQPEQHGVRTETDTDGGVDPEPRGIPLPLHSAPLTKLLLVINVVVYLLLTLFSREGYYSALVDGADPVTLVLFGAKVNQLILLGEYWRLLTAIFLHIGILHLLFNQYALWLFGREVEQLFGTMRFAVIYFLAGLFGSWASFAFSPAIAAGASGAIFGVLGALAIFFYRNRLLLGEMGRQQLRGLVGLLGINLLFGVVVPGIDNWGHLGGLIAGIGLGMLLAPHYAVERTPEPPFVQIVEEPGPVATPLVALASLLLLAFATYFAFPFAPV